MTIEDSSLWAPGGIFVDGTDFTLGNGGFLRSQVEGTADGGNVIINATGTMTLDGNRPAGAAITVRSNGVGKGGGRIEITGGNLNVEQAVLDADTSGFTDDGGVSTTMMARGESFQSGCEGERAGPVCGAAVREGCGEVIDASSPVLKRSCEPRRSGFRAAATLTLAALTLGLASVAHAGNEGADGHFEKRTSSHFVLYQDVDIDRSSGFRGSRRFEQQVLAILEQAYVQLDHFLGLRPERPISVVVLDPRIYDATYGGLFRFSSAGFYGDKIHVRGDVVVSDKLARTLHHELVHAALDAVAPSLVVPAWFNEGSAVWFEARGPKCLSRAIRMSRNE